MRPLTLHATAHRLNLERRLCMDFQVIWHIYLEEVLPPIDFASLTSIANLHRENQSKQDNYPSLTPEYRFLSR